MNKKMICKLCKHKLLRLDGNSQYYAYGCDNVYCHLFAHPQHYEPKNPGVISEATQSRRASHTYESYKAQKRENYRLLRNLDIKPKQASLMSNSNKQTQLALERSNGASMTGGVDG